MVIQAKSEGDGILGRLWWVGFRAEYGPGCSGAASKGRWWFLWLTAGVVALVESRTAVCTYYAPLGWHDAGTYDVNTKTGGPNGSIRNEEEYTHGANSALKIALDFCGRDSAPPRTLSGAN
ncbi:hypothetical protein CASFOL_033794 [Castilleja foliolosa]|uniref:Uncharacterized protein n=1 Tax=Castilleja foliolosa TaxID=1961234 RepID=A0ABD3BYU4_9LAMI